MKSEIGPSAGCVVHTIRFECALASTLPEACPYESEVIAGLKAFQCSKLSFAHPRGMTLWRVTVHGLLDLTPQLLKEGRVDLWQGVI